MSILDGGVSDLVGGGLGIIGNLIGGAQGNAAGADERGAGLNAINEAYAQLKNVGLPPDEARQIIYNQYKQAGTLTPEIEQAINQHPSLMAGVNGNDQAKATQLKALQVLQQRGETGLTPEDRAALNEIRQQSAADTNAKEQAVQQQFAMRGEGGSGAELIGKLQAAQSGANAESQAGDRLAAMASQNALQSIGAAGTLGGQIEQQQFGENAQKAKAQDVINQFNTQNQVNQQARNVAAGNNAQASNLNNVQNINNTNTNQANNELLRQNQAQRQQYLDTLNRATTINNAANGFNTSSQAAGNAAASRAAAPWETIGAGATTLGSSLAKKSNNDESDEDYNQGGEVQHYDDGGQVQPSLADKIASWLQPSDSNTPAIPSEDSRKDTQDSMRKAFGYAKGGPIAPPHILALQKIFPNSPPEILQQIHSKANPQVVLNHSDGGAVTHPYEHQRRLPVTDYRVGGHVPGKANVAGDSPKNDVVPAMLSPGEFVVKRSTAKSPFGKRLIKLLEAHHEVMKHSGEDNE